MWVRVACWFTVAGCFKAAITGSEAQTTLAEAMPHGRCTRGLQSRSWLEAHGYLYVGVTGV